MFSSALLAREPIGVSGWLLFVGLGLIHFGLESFEALLSGISSAGATAAQTGAFFAALDIAAALLLLGAAAWAMTLYVRASPRFPTAYIAFLSAAMVVILLRISLVALTAPSPTPIDDDSAKYALSVAIQALVGIPYILTSRRVANTFSNFRAA